MFSTLGLFQSLQCPQKTDCKRPRCIFSHRTDLPPPPSLNIPVDEPKPAPSVSNSAPTSAGTSNVLHTSQSSTASTSRVVPAKRSFEFSAQPSPSSSNGIREPARQRQKIGTSQKPVALPSVSHTSTGAPILRVNAAQSQVALPVRQAMVKSLYDHFLVLYEAILPTNPTLASEHALRQEEEVYKKANKLTYRNAVISSIASLKRRPTPTSISHPSVGTEEDIASRAESRKKLDALRLTRHVLAPLVLSLDDMQKWGYITDIPDGIGGDAPHAEGKVMPCERCAQAYMVKRHPEENECTFHWGKPFSKSINGERLRLYSCCSKSTNEDGCSRGFHVFYEKKPEDLHARHAFSFTRSPNGGASEGDAVSPSKPANTTLDVVSLDCEMIYTTGGMRVARVSVVDGSGTEIFDELVRMDEGVEVIDYNTRFSGVTLEEHSEASLSLSSIRKLLDNFIDSDTVIIGHALDNDLKTLRMIHHRCVDTAILFPHRAGPPYRQSLRNLAKEHLGLAIQTGGGTVGHSSVEDSIATLDLVRWYVLNKPKPRVAEKPPAPVVDLTNP
ncbi:ribonuclease H-like protein [Leucogyrophana mollusca]|uniref:Ribonuclease H-like protein n=1 Tax=Leucogyrophana mollusca TaxID=85980 RepID=A0ACB8B927_9AGAM|nr:ribonuclease H-like protein [Leucogyrophana mollusca]